MSIGFVKHGTLSEKKRLYWEVQLFALKAIIVLLFK